MSRVTLQVYSRYPGSLYRCIYDVPGHFTGEFTMSRVTVQVYLRCYGHLKGVFKGGDLIVVVGLT